MSTFAADSEKALSLAPVHKGSGFAVSGGKWFIAECKPTRERTIRRLLETAGYEAFIASRKEEVVYASRNRRVKETVLLPGKLFVRTDETQLMTIMLEYPSVHRFMIDRASSDREKNKRVYASISDAEKQELERMLADAPGSVTISTNELVIGQKIEVVRGPLKGMRGNLTRVESKDCLVLKMEMGATHYIYTEISLADLSICSLEK